MCSSLSHNNYKMPLSFICFHFPWPSAMLCSPLEHHSERLHARMPLFKKKKQPIYYVRESALHQKYNSCDKHLLAACRRLFPQKVLNLKCNFIWKLHYWLTDWNKHIYTRKKTLMLRLNRLSNMPNFRAGTSSPLFFSSHLSRNCLTLLTLSLLSCLSPSHTLSCCSSRPQAMTFILLSFPHSTLLLLLLILSTVQVPHAFDVQVFAVKTGSCPTWRQLDPDPACAQTTAASPPNPW